MSLIVRSQSGPSWILSHESDSWHRKNFPTYLSMSTMSINQFFMETNRFDSENHFAWSMSSERGHLDEIWHFHKKPSFAKDIPSNAVVWGKSKDRWYFLVGWSNKRRQGRPGSHLEVIEKGCRWYLDISKTKILYFRSVIEQKMAGSHLEVIERGCRWSELLPKPCLVWWSQERTQPAMLKNITAICWEKNQNRNKILDPVEILLRINGGHCQIPAWSLIRLVGQTPLKRSEMKQN